MASRAQAVERTVARLRILPTVLGSTLVVGHAGRQVEVYSFSWSWNGVGPVLIGTMDDDSGGVLARILSLRDLNGYVAGEPWLRLGTFLGIIVNNPDLVDTLNVVITFAYVSEQ